VNAENLAFNNCANTEVVEDLSAVFPWVSISVLSNSLIVETVDSCNLSSFVISSKESNVSRILELKAEEELESFDRVVTTINKVTHENVAGIRNLTTLIK